MYGCIINMIPNLPEETSDWEIPKFYSQIVDNLELRSSHHMAWYTHKRDSSVCWICDLVEVSKLCLKEMERFISKSAQDIDDKFIDQEKISSEDDEFVSELYDNDTSSDAK